MTTTWLGALDDTSARLAKIVHDLSAQQLDQPAFGKPGSWSLAQVLSHLGSAAEICTALVRRGADGDLTPPSADDTKPVWQRWDAMTGTEQRAAWLEADELHRRTLTTAGDGATIPYFAGPLSSTEYAGYRLSEQALHGWDVEVTLDPEAVVEHADLLWQRLDLVVSRFHDAGTRERLAPRTIDLTGARLELTDTGLHFTATGPADEAVLRLFYGRNRPGDVLGVAGETTAEDLRRLFPGF